MPAVPPPLPDQITRDEVLPYLRAIIVDGLHEQIAIRALERFWYDANRGGRIADLPKWRAVTELLDVVGRYEPNPQFCNRAAGMFDFPVLCDHVRRAIAAVESLPD